MLKAIVASALLAAVLGGTFERYFWAETVWE